MPRFAFPIEILQPRFRQTDAVARVPGQHVHPDYWTKDSQHRYEDRVAGEIKELEKAVEKLTQRVTLLMGAIGLLIFVIPVAAPFIRGLLNIP